MYYIGSLTEIMSPTLSLCRRPLYRRFLSTFDIRLIFTVPLPLAFFNSMNHHKWTGFCNGKKFVYYKFVYLSELRLSQ